MEVNFALKEPVMNFHLHIYGIASNYNLAVYFFPAIFTLASKREWRIYETGVYYLKFWIKRFSGDEL